ncbi:hypothetical protein BME96_06410 [Virgibacillus halodenitrificans]|uniref:Uncharacterized protein n=1 Tax=Virgibacillus halodenitrificans TaxID=1482 RepID=A0AAC9IXB7_VIRHA|nr:hypothetical protein [Virgibacillus halodenitrificans]APC47826.1 hypothetical protein BME96_06410 [Virgibacillus halodenitrificans]
MSITPMTDPNQENEPPILVPLDGGLIDAMVIPAYCLNCEKQLSHFFHYKGSRYGQVGEIVCNHCQSIIYCTDHDNIQHFIYMSPENYMNPFINNTLEQTPSKIDFNSLYMVNGEVMEKLRQTVASKSSTDPFKHHSRKMEIAELVDVSCKQLNIKSLPEESIITDERLPHLPGKVNRWLNLLRLLNII